MATNTITEAKPTLRKFIQFDQITDTITDLAAEYIKPEKLTSLWQEHKSGIIIAGIWLTLYLRSWVSVIPLPIPSFATLPLVLLILVSITLASPARTLKGLAFYTYHEVSSSITSITNKFLPTWLPRAVPIVLLFPITRAATILVLLAAWEVMGRYRSGVARVNEEADQAVHRAASAAEKAVEHVREARGLEMQAMQLATTVLDNNYDNKTSRTNAVSRVKMEVDGIVREVEALETKVDKARKLAENAKAATQEGSLELTEDMIVNIGKLADVVVQREKQVREKVEAVRARLWGLSLGKVSS